MVKKYVVHGGESKTHKPKDQLISVSQSPCDIATEDYVGLLDDKKDLLVAIKSKEADLIERLKHAGRIGISLRGRTLEVVDTPHMVKIKVKRMKVD